MELSVAQLSAGVSRSCPSSQTTARETNASMCSISRPRLLHVSPSRVVVGVTKQCRCRIQCTWPGAVKKVPRSGSGEVDEKKKRKTKTEPNAKQSTTMSQTGPTTKNLKKKHLVFSLLLVMLFSVFSLFCFSFFVPFFPFRNSQK